MIWGSHRGGYYVFYFVGWRHVVRWKSTDVSDEHVASIFGAEEYVK
jgi:hypothetical protein